MRVVHVITRFIRGGADENTLLTVNGQAALGHDVHLIYGDHHEQMIAALDPRVTAHHEPSLIRAVHPVTDLRCLFRLRGYLRRTAPDIVHTHESKAGILGRLAARLAGKAKIVHTVHILPFIGVPRHTAVVYLGLEKLVAPVTDAFIDVSPGMRDVCVEHRLGSTANHFVIESGMDTQRFREAQPLDEFRAGSDVVGLMAGTLEERKRVGPFIAELARARTDGWRLLVAGDGLEREAIATQLREAGLEDRVTMLGHRADLDQLIASADICVHAARNEGLPRVVVQYVLGGKPVAAAHLAGIERVVSDGVNGLIAGSEDMPGLARAFLTIADDAALRARMAAASRAVDLARWEHGAMVASIEEVYRWVAAAPSDREAIHVHDSQAKGA